MAGVTNIVTGSAARAERAERVSFRRLLWAAPLTVVTALAVCYAIKLIAQTLDPSLARMGQLGPALPLLTAEGSIGAVAVFALMAATLRRPIFWFRLVGTVVLLVSILPDLALGVGGSTAMLGMRAMSPFLSLGMPAPGGPRPGGSPGGGPLAGFVMQAMPTHQVLILVLLHAAVATVCIFLLSTLTRQPAPAEEAPGSAG